jgi:hypothetical protein
VRQYFFHDHALVYQGNDAYEVLADWAAERVGVPDLQNDVAPFLGGQDHFIDREGIAQDVLGQFGQFGLGLGFNPISGVDVEAAMDPRAQERARSGGRRLGLARNRMTLARKSYSSGLMGQSGKRRKVASGASDWAEAVLRVKSPSATRAWR